MIRNNSAGIIQFFSGVAILLVALILEFSLASSGMYLNVALATLIAFAFIFSFWELVFFDLLSVFFLNWQPAPSLVLFIFAFIPLAIFFVRIIARSESFVGNFAALFLGFFLFYLAVAPRMLIGNLGNFIIDVLVGWVVSAIVFFALKETYFH